MFKFVKKLKKLWAVEVEEEKREDSEISLRIARRAYELYEQRGREDGYEMEYWLQAEEEIRNQDEQEHGS